ncbi:MAG: polysaccharide biosynthesis tyrosine autokinase [Bacteroidia bacterium]
MQQNFDYRRLLILLTRYWWYFPLSLGIAIGTVWVYLRYTPVVYESNAVIRIEPSSLSQLLGSKDQIFSTGVEEVINGYIESFSSPELALAVLKKLGYFYEVYSEGRFGKSLLYPSPIKIQFGDSLSEEILKRKKLLRLEKKSSGELVYLDPIKENVPLKSPGWNRIDSAYLYIEEKINPGIYRVHFYSQEELISLFTGGVTVLPRRGLSILNVSFSDISSTRARDFLNHLIQEMRQQDLRIRQKMYDQMLVYIDTLLRGTQVELEKFENALLAQERASQVPFLEAYRALSVQQVLRPSEEKTQLEIQAKLNKPLLEQVSYIEKNLDSLPTLPPLIAFSEKAPLSDKIKVFNELLYERERLLRIYQITSEPIQRIHGILKERLKDLRRFIQYEYQIAAQYLGQLQNQAGYAQQRAYSLSEKEKKYMSIKQIYDKNVSIYLLLSEKRIQIGIEKSSITPSLSIIKPPTQPTVPTHPKPRELYAIAVVSGIVLALAIMILKDLLRQTLSYRADLETLAPIPILAELPYQKSPTQKIPASFSNLQIEVFRALRQNLEFLWDPHKPRILCTTSTVSGEGKTFITMGIGYGYSLVGHKVLLVDADLRKPTLTREFQLENFPGLSHLLSSKNPPSFQELIFHTPIQNMDILPAGAIPPNPAEILSSRRLDTLLAQLVETYDYILFDTSPIGLVADAMAIIQRSSIALYVFRADYSRINFLKHLNDIKAKHNLSHLYLIFNGTSLTRPHYGYGYGYGYYTYGEKSYYYNGQKTDTSWLSKLREWLPI